MKDLGVRFTEAERRVHDLVEENRRIRSRLRDLEQEATAAREAVRELERLRGKQGQVRERLERILSVLTALELEVPERKSEGPAGTKGP